MTLILCMLYVFIGAGYAEERERANGKPFGFFRRWQEFLGWPAAIGVLIARAVGHD